MNLLRNLPPALLAWCVMCSPVMADDWHTLARFALAAKQQNATPTLPWVGDLRLSRNPAAIRLADGAALLQRPRVVHSGYDRRVKHDLSGFYRQDNPRMNLLFHYAGRRAGEVLSLGLDTGHQAAKIAIAPALHLGYTRAYPVARQTRLALGVSGWFGGGVSETPCRDDYDREYYCPTLTAWSDYQPPRGGVNLHYSVVMRHDF